MTGVAGAMYALARAADPAATAALSVLGDARTPLQQRA
jgi:hypothetical protein